MCSVYIGYKIRTYSGYFILLQRFCVNYINGFAILISNYLVEYIGELNFIFIARYITDMWCT